MQAKQREEEEHNRLVLERQAQQMRKAKFAKESKEVEQLMVSISSSYVNHEYLAMINLTDKSLTIYYTSILQEMNSFMLQQRRLKNVQSKKKQEERKHAIEKQSRYASAQLIAEQEKHKLFWP